MTEFVVLSRVDIHLLRADKPVTIWINRKPYILCTDEYFEKQMRDSKAESKEDEDVEPCETNLQALQKMDAEELGLLLTDIEHYDDENHQWHSNLTPLLPFEDWKDWLNRRAIYGKG